ncbi:G protein-activated inward rectifier potassium channel 3-like isoform X2 [Thrips palmi]|uniref:G protein-activated inward rectifier potassium channel 3-like isoform X2 n=1 Tax=Thrips palmi TaxID=161013 RepID=A0A6P8ZDE3_THRPL|nr:G protein-activated inward rectifier potassium channel 3-like isoform X2 [Thrips palmi]
MHQMQPSGAQRSAAQPPADEPAPTDPRVVPSISLTLGTPEPSGPSRTSTAPSSCCEAEPLAALDHGHHHHGDALAGENRHLDGDAFSDAPDRYIDDNDEVELEEDDEDEDEGIHFGAGPDGKAPEYSALLSPPGLLAYPERGHRLVPQTHLQRLYLHAAPASATSLLLDSPLVVTQPGAEPTKLFRVSTNSSVLNAKPVSSDGSRSGRYPSSQRRLRRRAVLKNGECNVLQSKISNMNLRFLQDIFTTLVDVQWRWTLLVFSLSFFLSWLTFALIWWLIAFTHGDLEVEHLPEMQEEKGWHPCVANIHDFGSCFLFSVETQHTIGYGGRATTEECPEAIFVMCLQSIVGVMIQAFMTGIVFAKLSRPKKRTQTLLFSRQAVICVRDGELCLMFRVGDMRKSHIVGASIRAQLIRTKTTQEGETLAPFQHELTLSADDCGSDLFFIWPTVVVHKIDSASPLWNMSAVDMMHEKFEIVVILEGTIETTSQTTQARSSYLPVEILWGHRFTPMVTYCRERHGYQVDYSLFHCTTAVDTPLCSAKDLAAFHRHHAALPGEDWTMA